MTLVVLSGCGSVALSGVLVVTDASVPLFRDGCHERSFVVGLRLGDCGTAVFSLSPESVQGHMCYEGTPVKAPPASRRKIMPPTPQQSSQSSIEAVQ